MADDAQTLTEQHRQAQNSVRSHALRDFLVLWPLWKGDSASFQSLVQATVPLVTVYRQASAALASSYYEAIRRAEQVPGEVSISLPAPLPTEQLARSMFVTGDAMTRDALTAGQSADQARTTALTRVSGAVSRHVVNAGRETILDAVAADEKALGWARVTDGDPCYFCLTLASRGAIYKTEQSAGFKAHDHCGCSAMPVFSRDTVIPGYKQWRDTYRAAQRDGVESGLLQHGENTSAARLNAVRRYLAATH